MSIAVHHSRDPDRDRPRRFRMLASEGDSAPSQAVVHPVAASGPSAKKAAAKAVTASKVKQATAASAHPRAAIAQGFGSDVPLDFAVRQIVPAGFEVAFGPSVDADARVDWRGGKPWAAALADAVRPMGLAVAVHARRVDIYPVSKPR